MPARRSVVWSTVSCVRRYRCLAFSVSQDAQIRRLSLLSWETERDRGFVQMRRMVVVYMVSSVTGMSLYFFLTFGLWCLRNYEKQNLTLKMKC